MSFAPCSISYTATLPTVTGSLFILAAKISLDPENTYTIIKKITIKMISQRQFEFKILLPMDYKDGEYHHRSRNTTDSGMYTFAILQSCGCNETNRC